MVVVMLLAVSTYYMASNADDTTAGNIEIDGLDEYNAGMVGPMLDGDEREYEDTDENASEKQPGKSKNNRKIGGQQDRAADVYFEDNDRIRLKYEKIHQDGKNADGGEYDRERRGPEADDKGDERDTADGDGEADVEGGRVRGQAANNDNKIEKDSVDGDDGLGYDDGKDTGEDTKEDEVGRDADNGNQDKNEGDNAVDGDNSKSYDTCDAECQRFRSQLASWPSNKPKAFIYYLIHRKAMRSLRRSIGALHRYFNHRFRYPIVVFVEPGLDNIADRQRIADMVPADSKSLPPSIYIQVVRFRIPDYVNASLVPRMAGFGSRKRTIAYRHMCRFHAGGVYDQPIVRSPGLEYSWRLDDDSLIRRPIDFDLFQVMRDGGYQYGYRKINSGWSPVDYALWDAVDRYLNATPSLTTTFYRQWPKNAARYFNNFEVSYLPVWMSPQYRDYLKFVDRLGGIYYYKWGDAAIKTIAVTLFIPRDRTHLFTGIAYSHT